MAFIAAPSSNHTKLAGFMCLLSWLFQSKMLFALTIARFKQVQTKNAILLYSLCNLLDKGGASLLSAALFLSSKSINRIDQRRKVLASAKTNLEAVISFCFSILSSIFCESLLL